MTPETARRLGEAAGLNSAKQAVHGTVGIALLRLGHAVYLAGGSEALAAWLQAHIEAYDRERYRGKSLRV